VSTLHLLVQPRHGEAFRHEVRGEAAVLGRSSKADVVLAARYLSRQHARLVLRQGSWFLENLGSRNTEARRDPARARAHRRSRSTRAGSRRR